MPETMLAYRLTDWQHPPELVRVDVPRPAADEVVIRVAGNGLCHSDMTMAQMPHEIGEMLDWHMPFTLGHEIAGWVHDAGDGVTGLTAGEAVVLSSPASCGVCTFCIRGQDSACPNGNVGRGFGRDGGLAQFVVAGTARGVIRLGALDPVSAGPLTDAGATSYHAVKRALPRLIPGSTAVVIGAGGLGAFAVQFLRALSPARVVAVDISPARREYAREVGADEVIDGVTDKTAAELREITRGEGAEVVLDFVGTDATITEGLRSVRSFGAFGLIGAAFGTFKAPWYGGLPRDADVFHFQTSTLADLQEVIALAESGVIRNEVDLFPLDRVADAYATLERGELRGRAVVTPPD